MFEVVLSGAAKVKFFQNGKVQSEHITIYHNISQYITMLQNGCRPEEMGDTSSWTLHVSRISDNDIDDIAESARSTVKG